MTGRTTISAWGNSQGVRLTKSILETAKFSLADVLQVEASENTIILRKVPKHKPFSERLAEYNGEITVCDFDWGEPKGREII